MLSHFGIEKAKPKERAYKLSDGNGLHILIRPNGSKLWQFRYRFVGKENTLSFGAFPEVSIADAREKTTAARKLIKEGKDPAQERQVQKVEQAAAAENTFGLVAKEYLDQLREMARAPRTLEKNEWLLLDLASPLEKRPITEVTSAEILAILKKIEKSGRRETAVTLRGAIGSVFRYAIANLKAQNDPTYALRGSLLKPKVTHRPAITDEVRFGALMTSIDEYDGWPTIRAALQFTAFAVARPGDIRHMKRNEVIWPKALWRIPAERMKMRRPHDVPLSKQALEVLRAAWSFSEGGELVFPSIRTLKKPLSENALNSALRRMGYAKHEHCAHGFRSSFSTILNERRFDAEVIEAALAHEEEDEIRAAYNRTTYLPQRVVLMQQWADLIDEFKAQVPLRARA